MTLDLDMLNSRHALAGALRFTRADNGPTLAEIANPLGSASIALEGGQILTWAPKDQEAVVWLSPQAKYTAGKSLRGGIPVCWPWFGPHATESAFPAHGFARNKPWDVASSEQLTDGATRLTLKLQQDQETAAWWPHRAELTLTVTVGAVLRIELATRNLGNQPLTLSEALHTYFHVSDIGAVSVNGLEGCAFLDKVDGGARKTQDGAVTIVGEVDRVYLGTTATAVIHDPGLKRRIRIAKSGSRSTVVWNPWAEKGAKFGDMGDDGYRRMLCVETANALDDAVTVAPGDTHVLMAEYAVEA
ncbi:MAG: D-hexose-6-phosphate mutarotase [Sulfuricellaceae bacterium]|jgi:glucose-6-phosphate 1-epimerase